MQDPPDPPSRPGSLLLRAHQWTQTPPGRSALTWSSEWGDPFHQQVPRTSWPTNGGRRELPGEGVWLMQLSGALYQGQKDGSPPLVCVLSFFLFSCLFGSRTIQVQMRSGSEQFPVKQKPFKVNKQVSAKWEERDSCIKAALREERENK